MGIPVIRGRGFNDRDTAASGPVAVVNENPRAKVLADGGIGKRLRIYYDRNPDRRLTIVGIVRDVRYRGRLQRQRLCGRPSDSRISSCPSCHLDRSHASHPV